MVVWTRQATMKLDGLSRLTEEGEGKEGIRETSSYLVLEADGLVPCLWSCRESSLMT